MATLSGTQQKITPFLWYDNNAEEAATFYCSLFKNSKIIHSSPMIVTFELEGMRFMAINGGPHFKLTEAFSLMVSCENQDEVDEFWNQLTANGEESKCGWLKDQFGLSWQIVPKVLFELMGNPDREKSQRVMNAILQMKKLDIATLQRAFDGVE